MTVQCISCSRWVARKGLPRELARLGLAHCSALSEHAGHLFTAEYERECDRFAAAPGAGVAKRASWLGITVVASAPSSAAEEPPAARA